MLQVAGEAAASESMFDAISAEAFEVFDSIESAPLFFLQRTGYMRDSGIADAIVAAGRWCILCWSP